MTTQKKKGQMSNVLLPIVTVAIILVVVAIVMAIGQNLLSEQKTELLTAETQTATCNVSSGITTSCGYAVNSTMGNVRKWAYSS